MTASTPTPGATPDTPRRTPDRRQLKRAYREARDRAGVYAIRCLASGRVVVAGSLDAHGALARHRFELQHGTHRDPALRAAWSAHGEAGIVFEVLDVVKVRDEPGFDLARELAALVALWQDELAGPQAPAATAVSP